MNADDLVRRQIGELVIANIVLQCRVRDLEAKLAEKEPAQVPDEPPQK